MSPRRWVGSLSVLYCADHASNKERASKVLTGFFPPQTTPVGARSTPICRWVMFIEILLFFAGRSSHKRASVANMLAGHISR